MEELKHYVYVYLDPRKSGKYEYFDQGIGISFDFEPFYIGEGKNKRLYSHMKRVNKDIIHPFIQKIEKIMDFNLEPIIYKIFEFKNSQDALNFERLLGFLIGRKDQKRGPLTNLIDCGGKATNKSQLTLEKQINSLSITLKNNPNIIEVARINHKNTLKNNPEILKNAGKNISSARKMKSEEELLQWIDNIKSTMKENPEIKINACKKQSKTKIDNKISCGKNNSYYIKLNHSFIIELYFDRHSCHDILTIYNKSNKKISGVCIKKVIDILHFPINTTYFKKKREIYLKFIEENKHKIQWYIDNYERLEEEYYNKKWEERYKKYYENN